MNQAIQNTFSQLAKIAAWLWVWQGLIAVGGAQNGKWMFWALIWRVKSTTHERCRYHTTRKMLRKIDGNLSHNYTTIKLHTSKRNGVFFFDILPSSRFVFLSKGKLQCMVCFINLSIFASLPWKLCHKVRTQLFNISENNGVVLPFIYLLRYFEDHWPQQVNLSFALFHRDARCVKRKERHSVASKS